MSKSKQRDLLEEYERTTKKTTTARYMEIIYPYAWTMIILTLLYLVVELSFGATLLDVAGKANDPDDLKKVEFFGRCISATAVVLAIFGSMLKKVFITNGSRIDFVVKVAIMAVIVFPMVFFGEEHLIEHLVDKSSGQERKNALWMTVIGERLLGGDVKLDGIAFSTGEDNKAADKSFIALLPFWGSTVQDVTLKAENLMGYISRKSAEDRVETKVGGDFYEKAYKASVERLHNIYNNKYVPGSNSYARTINDVDSQVDKYWREYVSTLEAKGYRPNAIPKYARSTVVKRVQNKGIPVPDEWHPNDRLTFYKAARKEVRKKANAEYKSGVNSALGYKSSLEPGLSWNQFVRAPDVQKQWKAQLGVKTSTPLRANMSRSEVEALLYKPIVKKIDTQTKTTLKASAEAYADKGKYEDLGRDAYHAVIVPPVALGFSMAGGLVHLIKLMNYFLMLVIFSKKIRMRIIMLAIVTLFTAPMFVSNHITSSRLITNLRKASIGDPGLMATTTSLVWIVNSQSIFYPINKTLREGTHIEEIGPPEMWGRLGEK
jgi:hypothetical protein